jgi:hypothetical protein
MDSNGMWSAVFVETAVPGEGALNVYTSRLSATSGHKDENGVSGAVYPATIFALPYLHVNAGT